MCCIIDGFCICVILLSIFDIAFYGPLGYWWGAGLSYFLTGVSNRSITNLLCFLVMALMVVFMRIEVRNTRSY